MNYSYLTERERKLAQEVMECSRKEIVRQMPLLMPALYALEYREKAELEPISVDGISLWYHPQEVLETFMKDQATMQRQILHVTLHCLLGHLHARVSYEKKDLFDAVADCKAEEFIYRLQEKAGRISHGWIWLSEEMMECEGYPLGQNYHRYAKDKNWTSDFIRGVRKSKLYVDNHDLWRRKEMVTEQDGVSLGTAENKNTLPNWQELCTELMAQIGASERWGSLAGMMTEDIRPSEENDITYEELLRRFVVTQEKNRNDPDTIDANWYHLGMELYGDMPLLEPLESSEHPDCGSIVIAVDTSGSCEGNICRRFLRETLHLLRDISGGMDTLDVLLLQCDVQIEQELYLEQAVSEEELLERFMPQGFGGTDFCPVFDRIEELQEKGKLAEMRGLLYLSDGCGVFPERKPDYPVVFIIPEEERWGTERIPAWITKVILKENGFEVEEARA